MITGRDPRPQPLSRGRVEQPPSDTHWSHCASVTSLPGGVFGAVFVVMLIMFIMGFFLDFIEITFIVVPFVAPIALAFFGPDMMVWFGVVVAMNLQASFLTPPFGFALFYLKGVAPPEVRTMDIYRGIIPFVVIQMIAVGEQSGSLDKMLAKAADSYEKEVEAKVMAMTSMIEPIMILLMGGAVGFIVMSILLPIFEMNQLVK